MPETIEVLGEDGEVRFYLCVWAEDTVRVEVEAKDTVNIAVTDDAP